MAAVVGTPWRIEVFTVPVSPLGAAPVITAVVPRFREATYLEELNGTGGGSFKVRVDDPVFQEHGADVFAEGRLVRMTLANRVVGWFEIMRPGSGRETTVDDDGVQWLTVAGEGPLAWLDHAVLFPVKASGEVRRFDFTSPTGTWKDRYTWATPVLTPYSAAGTPWWRGAPVDWPSGTGTRWMWDRPAAMTNPAGDCFFRYEFSTSVANEPFELFFSPDNMGVVVIDGEKIVEGTDLFAWRKTYRASLELDAGPHVLAVQVRNRTVSPAGFVLIMAEPTPDDAEPGEIGHVRISTATTTGWQVCAYPGSMPGWTAGEMLTKVLDEGVARGVHGLARLARGFTATTDSEGVSWVRGVPWAFEVGATIRDVADEVAATVADVWVDGGLTLQAAARRGTAPTNMVRLQPGLNVTEASARATDRPVVNHLLLRTTQGFQEVEHTASADLYGRREAYLSVPQEGAEDLLIDQVWAAQALPRRYPTVQIEAIGGATPWLDFEVGDDVMAPSDKQPFVLEQRRVMSIAGKQDDDTGRVVFEIEIDSIQEQDDARLQRLLARTDHRLLAGSVVGGSTSTGVGAPTSGATPSPAPLPPRPAAPTSLVAVASGYQDPGTGDTWGRTSLSWEGVSLDAMGGPVVIQRYEVWGRRTLPAAGILQQITATSGNEAVHQAVPVGETWEYFVRAVSDAGQFSTWSNAATATMPVDTVAPLPPAAPSAWAERGVIVVAYDWLDADLDPMAPDTDRVEVAMGTATAPTTIRPEKFGGPSTLVIVGAPYDVQQFIRLRAIDRSGNVSGWSAEATVTPTPLVGSDVPTLADLIDQQAIDIAAAQADADAAQGTADTAAGNALIAIDSASAAIAMQSYATNASFEDWSGTVPAGFTAWNLLPVKDTVNKRYGKWAAKWNVTSSGQQAGMAYAGNLTHMPNVEYVTVDVEFMLLAGGISGAGFQVQWLFGTTEVNAFIDLDEEIPTPTVGKWYRLTKVLKRPSDPGTAFTQVRGWVFVNRSTLGDAIKEYVLDWFDVRPSTEEEITAYGTPALVQQVADSRPQMLMSTNDPSGTAPYGSIWWKVDVNGNVIGQWQQTASPTGSTWTPRAVTSEVIANLDVGKLTASAAEIGILVAQKIAAASGQYIDLVAANFSANLIIGDYIAAGAIEGQHLAIGAVGPANTTFGIDELAPNPNWSDTDRQALFPAPAQWQYVTTAGYLRHGQTHVVATQPAAFTMQSRFHVSDYITVTSGDRIWLRMETVVDGAPNYDLALQLLCYNDALQTPTGGYAALVTALRASAISYTDGATLVTEGTVVVPDGVTKARLNFVPVGAADYGALTGVWVVNSMSARRVMSSVSQGGQRVEISPDGLRLWGLGDEGEPTISLTTGDTQSMTILNAADEKIAGMDAVGGVVGKSVIANDSLYVRGQELDEYLSPLPTGHLYRAELSGNRIEYIEGWYGICMAQATVTGDRTWKIECGVQTYPNADGTTPEVYGNVRYTTNGTTPTVSSSTLGAGEYALGKGEASTFDSKRFTVQVRTTWAVGTVVKMLLCVRRGNGTTGVRVQPGDQTFIEVSDNGPGRAEFANHVSGGGTLQSGTAPTQTTPKVTYTTEWAPTGWKSFMYDGTAEYSGTGPGASYAMQGYTAYWSAGGIQKSHVYFNSADIRSKLSGATINSVQVYAKAVHWYSSTGGTGRLHQHNYDSSPGSAGSMTHLGDIGFARGEGKWITVSGAFGAALKGGTARGIGWDSIGSTSTTYYGYFDPMATRIKITYTK